MEKKIEIDEKKEPRERMNGLKNRNRISKMNKSRLPSQSARHEQCNEIE